MYSMLTWAQIITFENGAKGVGQATTIAHEPTPWGQTHYLSDPTFEESLFTTHKLPIFKEEIDRNLKVYA